MQGFQAVPPCLIAPVACAILKRLTAGDVYRALWRHKFLIVALTAAFVGAAWYATSLQSRKYEASTLVRIQPGYRGADPLSAIQASERIAQTYAEIIDAGALDSRVKALVSSQISPRESSGVSLSGHPVQDLELMWISARSKDPTRATIVANAVPRALEDFIKASTFGDEAVTVKRATTPSVPVSPRTAWNVAIALVLALIFNSALVLLIEVFRDRLPEPEELRQVVGHPILATVPTLRLRRMTAVEGGAEEVGMFGGEQTEEPVGAREDDHGRSRRQ
jgi:succinoglycan biosynthesis transport protein ExoP